jgi:deazaflavin-dependent oxidoreductase (nitroreductase family)
VGVLVEVAEQAHLGQMVDQLAVDVQHQRCYLLTVRGRKTGQLRTTPVDVMETGGQRWLVAGYGPAAWVRNARAAGEVTLSRGGHQARYAIAEPTPDEAVRVLRKYMTDIRVTRAYFDATPASPDSQVEAELARHPVLRLVPKS